MPTSTYTPIATVTLGATASSVIFSNISADYRDIVFSVQPIVSASSQMRMRLNGDTASTYTTLLITCTGTSEGVITRNDVGFMQFSVQTYATTTSQYANGSILDSGATDKFKTLLFGSGRSGSVDIGYSRFPSTGRITSMEFILATGSFVAGSTFSLYGVIA